MCLFDSLFSLLGYCWEFSTRHPAITLVLLGVLGEGFEILSKKFFKHWYEKHESSVETFGVICWAIVMLGLAWEIPDSAKADRDAAALNKEAADARLETAELQKQIELTKRIRVSDLSFATNLLTIPGIMVDLRWENDNDARLTVLNFMYAFSMGGWRIAKLDELTNRPSSSWPLAITLKEPFGIGIIFSKKGRFPNDKAEKAANLLYGELSKRGEAVNLEQNDETNILINTIIVVVGQRVGSEEYSNYFENLSKWQKWSDNNFPNNVRK